MSIEGVTLERVNQLLQKAGASLLEKIDKLDNFLFMAKVQDGPHVIVRIDPTFADTWLERGHLVEDIFVVTYYATLFRGVDANGVVDAMTGNPFPARKYLGRVTTYPDPQLE